MAMVLTHNEEISSGEIGFTIFHDDIFKEYDYMYESTSRIYNHYNKTKQEVYNAYIEFCEFWEVEPIINSIYDLA